HDVEPATAGVAARGRRDGDRETVGRVDDEVVGAAIPRYTVSGANRLPVPVAARSRVRSKIINPCCPAPSPVMKAWSLYTLMSRAPLGGAGISPTTRGLLASVRSTNTSAPVRPTRAYSRRVAGSVQPQRSLTRSPGPPPRLSIERNAERSTSWQANSPALPSVQRTSPAVTAGGVAAGPSSTGGLPARRSRGKIQTRPRPPTAFWSPTARPSGPIASALPNAREAPFGGARSPTGCHPAAPRRMWRTAPPPAPIRRSAPETASAVTRRAGPSPSATRPDSRHPP